MSKQSKLLPVRPSLEHLKSQAKDLLAAIRREDVAAFVRVRQSLPAAYGATDAAIRKLGLALHDAQSIIAREYGASSWTELRDQVTAKAAGIGAATLRELMARQGVELGPVVEAALVAAAARPLPTLELPAELPLIPLRNALLPVGTVAPIHVGRATSLAALSAAQVGAGFLAFFTQKDGENETPSEADLHPVGCVAEICAVLPKVEVPVPSDPEPGTESPGKGTGELTIVVRSIAWVSHAGLVRAAPFGLVRVEPFVVDEQLSSNDAALERELRVRVRQLVLGLPDGERLRQMTERMSPLELADATLANLQCDIAAKATYAREPSVAGRLRQVLALLDAQAPAA